MRAEIIPTLRGRFDRQIVVKQTTIQAIDIYCEKTGGEKRSEREGFVQDASLVAKGAENGACGSPAKQFQNLPGMTEPCRTRVDCYTDSPPVRKLWGGILPRSDTSAFPRDASGGFTRCCYLSHCVGQEWERGFGVFVDICRILSDEGRARL